VRLRRISMCDLSGCTTFFTHLVNYDFQEKVYWTQNACFGSIYNSCLEHLSILRRKVRDAIKVRWSSCKAPVILIRLYWNSTDYGKIHVSTFMKNRPVGAELFLAGGRTDKQKAWRSWLSFFAILRKRLTRMRVVLCLRWLFVDI